jgi:hypothetical protein
LSTTVSSINATASFSKVFIDIRAWHVRKDHKRPIMAAYEHQYMREMMRMRVREQELFTRRSASLIELLSWDVRVVLFRLTTWRLKADFIKKHGQLVMLVATGDH